MREAAQGAAVCLSGQVRSYGRVRDRLSGLSSIFGPTELLLFVNLQDSGKGGRTLHGLSDVQAPVAKMPLAAIHLYNESSYQEAARAARATCWSSKPGHFAHHFAQMWTIAQCAALVRKRESERNMAYKWGMRGRPDMYLTPVVYTSIRTAVQHTSAQRRPTAWLGTGVGGDRMELLTRSALGALESVTQLFSETNCGVSNASRWRPSRRECMAAGASAHGTECVLITALTRGGVQTVPNVHLRVPIVRLSNGSPNMARRLAQPSHALSESLAICVCGQGRTFMHVALNLRRAMGTLIATGAHVFFAVDRTIRPSSKQKLNTSSLESALRSFGRRASWSVVEVHLSSTPDVLHDEACSRQRHPGKGSTSHVRGLAG